MSTTFDEIRDAVLSWCNEITGRTVVLANTGEQAQLNVESVEVFISQITAPTFEESVISEDGLTETIESNTFLRVQLDVFGGNAMQAASKLARSLWSQRRYLDLWTIVGLSKINETLDLTALLTGTRRARAQFSFDVYCILADDFESDFIEEIETTLVIEDRGSATFILPLPDGCNDIPKPIQDNFGNYVMDNLGNSLYTNN